MVRLKKCYLANISKGARTSPKVRGPAKLRSHLDSRVITNLSIVRGRKPDFGLRYAKLGRA